jgi:hypothetical protein
MGSAVRAVEAIAPTRQHAGVESAKHNLAVGPFASMLDRPCDAIQQAIGEALARTGMMTLWADLEIRRGDRNFDQLAGLSKTVAPPGVASSM